jgi:hypothetical protein
MNAPFYHCASELRRAAVKNKAGWNGIDYLEVDPNSNIDVPLTLRVAFVKTDGLAALNAANFRITGGVRYPEPKISLAAQEAAGSTVVIVTLGTPLLTDYSTYTLQLITPGSNAPPNNFDPRLSAVDFTFKVNCPTPFDCAPQDYSAPAPARVEPDLDYGARDWGSLRRLMLDRLAALLPGFRDDTPVDFLVTQVEALAYVADHLSYKLDALASEKNLWTARSRISLARHARLLDYPVHEGCNARCFAAFEYSEASGAVLEKGTPLLPRSGAQMRVLGTADFVRLLPSEPVVFETMHPVNLDIGNNAIDFHTWSDEQCSLPRGATRATLKLHGSPSNPGDPPGPAAQLAVGDFLLLAQTRSPDNGQAAYADRSKRHVVRLISVVPANDPIDGIALLEVEWDSVDALPFDLPISVDVAQGAGNTAVRTVCAQAAGNIALADHGATLPAAKATASEAAGLRPRLDPPAAPKSGRWRPRLSRSDLVRAATIDLDARPGAEVQGVPRLDLLANPQLTARGVMQNDPAAALPVIALQDTFSEWTCRRDLLSSERFDRDVVIETEHDGTVQLRFGDNIMGLAPAPGSGVTVKGRFGEPLTGNIGADVLWHVVTGLAGVKAVRNPLPASGGTAPLSPTVIRIEAPQAFRVQQRAVTEADWVEVAQRHPEVSRAVARVRWTGAWRTVFVHVDRKGGLPVESDKPFCARMLAHLERYRLAGVDLALRGPVPVSLDINLKICVFPGHLRADVLLGVLRRLAATPIDDGQPGFFHPDSFTFGTPLYLSVLIAAVMEVPGVASVEPVRFQRWAKAGVNELGNGVIHAGEFEVLRLDNDPDFPENGILSVELQGGT